MGGGYPELQDKAKKYNLKSDLKEDELRKMIEAYEAGQVSNIPVENVAGRSNVVIVKSGGGGGSCTPILIVLLVCCCLCLIVGLPFLIIL